MKRFIVISLLVSAAVASEACSWTDTHNYYLFSPYADNEFRTRVEQTCNDNWKSYLGSTSDYFYFDADEIISAARRKGDVLMVSYVQNLQKYLECVSEKRQEQWDYPTKAQLNARRQKLTAIRAYAQSKLRTRLRSQHALLVMRCNMMLGQHQRNITFWQQTASRLIETVYQDMMRNIYAGALLHAGREADAGRIFAEQGDNESLMTLYYKRRSFQAIRQEYDRDPNSPVLPFLLKDFVNNTQEAVDIRQGAVASGKLFVRDIQRQEALQMCRFCQQAVSEGRSHSPVLWQSAKAWLEYLLGSQQQALDDIRAAMLLKGTERMKDNARALQLFITATQSRPGTAFDDYLAAELQWLDDRKTIDDHFGRVLDRLVHQVLTAKYASQPVTAVALMRATDCSLYETYVDTMRVGVLQQYIDYTGSTATTPLDRYLKPRQNLDRTAMSDLMGTKYMRLCQWQQAVGWLQQVPLSYYSQKGYAVYAAHRRIDIEPWIKRQWLKRDVEYGGQEWQLPSNPKLDFAQQMLTAELPSATSTAQAKYNLAVRYAQAHFTGDCWFLMRDGKSISDTLRRNETDLAQKALQLLQEASLTTDFQLKERALFAMSYVGLYPTPWYESIWNSQTVDYDHKPNPQALQYRAFAALASFERQNATRTSQYVSRCDEYRQFLKQAR